ncbi:hypothetical protein D3C77_371190 [compost metagenome]
MDSAAYGQRGVGRVFAGNVAGPLLAFGPQLVIDINDSANAEEFLRKSAYSQPTNALVFASGLLIGTAGMAAVVAIPIMLVAGVAIQLIMSDSGTGLGTSIGNYLTGKD